MEACLVQLQLSKNVLRSGWGQGGQRRLVRKIFIDLLGFQSWFFILVDDTWCESQKVCVCPQADKTERRENVPTKGSKMSTSRQCEMIYHIQETRNTSSWLEQRDRLALGHLGPQRKRGQGYLFSWLRREDQRLNAEHGEIQKGLVQWGNMSLSRNDWGLKCD